MRRQAIILIGPTGCGKTPLGHLLGARTLGRRQCIHFDFGERLRASVNEESGVLTSDERNFVSALLRHGALLEDAYFPIAEKLLVHFLTRRNTDRDKLVVLNGLPRHTGQAKELEASLDIRALINLECEPEITWERIRANSGGDRTGRSDDMFEEVKKRIEIFRQVTMPLIEYYSTRGTSILSATIGVKTTPEETYRAVEMQWANMINTKADGADK